MTTTLNKQLLMQVGQVHDIMTTTTTRTQEYTAMKQKLNSTGIYILKYLQRRVADRRYNATKRNKEQQPSESNSEQEQQQHNATNTSTTATSDEKNDANNNNTTNTTDNINETPSQQKRHTIETLSNMLAKATANNNTTNIKRYSIWIDLITNHSHVTLSRDMAKEMKRYRRKERRKRQRIITDTSLDAQ